MGIKFRATFFDAMEASEPSAVIESISAVTFVTQNMAAATSFYTALGFDLARGGGESNFSTFRAGLQYLNLSVEIEGKRKLSNQALWGRAIFYVSDVDEIYRRAKRAHLNPSFAPKDASWGERYFHISDPDGNELSFARRLPEKS